MRSTTQVSRFISDRRMVLQTGRSALPALTNAIAGRVLNGSWMANPEVHHIYRLMSRLPKERALVAALVLGKETIVVPDLAPAVHVVAADDTRRNWALSQLPPIACRLLDDVEATGSVRMDHWSVKGKDARDARYVLQNQLLVWSDELHTERGSHTTVVRPWHGSPVATAAAGVSESTMDEAAAALFDAALHAAVIAPEREAGRWFSFLPTSPLEQALDEGRAVRLDTKPPVLTAAEYL